MENLKIYKKIIKKREINYNFLKNNLKNHIGFLKKDLKNKDSYYVLPVLVKKRSELIKYLNKKNIETRIHHLPLMPMNIQPFMMKEQVCGLIHNLAALLEVIQVEN